ncbi:unnamed protein product [Sphagnum troendelagicum]
MPLCRHSLCFVYGFMERLSGEALKPDIAASLEMDTAPLSPILLEQCLKGSSTGCCNHPWCGTLLLVSSPVGLTLDSVVESEGCISADEALHCCYGCLSALQSAVSVAIQHRDINSEHVMWVMGDNVMSITMC